MSGLKTSRLCLRRPEPSDAVALQAALDDFEVSKWLAVVPSPYTIADADGFIGEVVAGRLRAWIIDDGGLAGVIGHDEALGYWIARDRWGRGYATEAARAVLGQHFALSDDDVRSGHFRNNHASARVLEKLGFRPAGERRLFCRARGEEVESRAMILSRDDWRAASA